MGVLRDHNLQQWIDKGYTVFAETGTGRGTGIQHALSHSFDSVYSCDIDRDQINVLRTMIKDPRLVLFPTDSITYLNALLCQDERFGGEPPILARDRVVWFLDSHFPGFDLRGAPIDAEPNLDIRLPLHSELDTLYEYDRFHDVIIADDMRCYEPGAYQGGTMASMGYGHVTRYDKPLPLARWEKTHIITRDLRDSGYLCLFPRSLS